MYLSIFNLNNKKRIKPSDKPMYTQFFNTWVDRCSLLK